MGQIIDLFSKQVLGLDDDPEFAAVLEKGSDSVVGTDDEDWFVEQFFEKYLGEFNFCALNLQEATTVQELEEAIRCVQEQVAKWPTPG